MPLRHETHLIGVHDGVSTDSPKKRNMSRYIVFLGFEPHALAKPHAQPHAHNARFITDGHTKDICLEEFVTKHRFGRKVAYPEPKPAI